MCQRSAFRQHRLLAVYHAAALWLLSACLQRVFAVNSVAIGIVAALSVKFRRTESATFYGSLLMVAFSAAEFAALALSAPFWVYETLLFAILFSLGLTFTSTTTLAMNLARDNAGTASAVFGAAGFALADLCRRW